MKVIAANRISADHAASAPAFAMRAVSSLAAAFLIGGTVSALATESRLPEKIGDKTLVAWVSPANLGQQGSGAISLMNGERFDALVLGEKQAGKWMAGSDYFKRTQADQTGSQVETVQTGQTVQIAIAYAGNHITIYRNGQRYSDYDAGSREVFDRETAILIGARYRGGLGEIGFFAGDIEEVRLYDRALDAEAIQSLQPGRRGKPEPLGMWTFSGGDVSDQMGNYPKGRLMNGATVVDGKLRLDGRAAYVLVTEPPGVQAGFFTPMRKGQIWDSWVYYYEGMYYMYYLAGPLGQWDEHELATSGDGVHWQEYGVVVKPRTGVTWIGTGHIWKSPDFDKTHTWVMNYSEWFGDKQDIMFITSKDLLNWTKVDEKRRFVQDTRWYKEKGRWDCIDAIQRADGSLYGYFTADPADGKVAYRPCGFGFAESKDGVAWTALPPVEGDMSGEFGGIQKIGEKYYIIISEGRIAVGDKPEGPFLAQKKNPNAFGPNCDIYFPRFFHNAPGGPLVNHFYTGGMVYAAPLKAIEVDSEGILRLKWWKNNDKLKARPVEAKLVAAGKEYSSSLRMLDAKLDLGRTHLIEGTVADVPPSAGVGGKRGIYLDQGGGQGQCLLLGRDGVQFGEIKADGSGFKVFQTSNRDLDLGQVQKFRLVIHGDMVELYINDYLMNLKRMSCNGQIGFMGAGEAGAFRNIKVWQSN